MIAAPTSFSTVPSTPFSAPFGTAPDDAPGRTGAGKG